MRRQRLLAQGLRLHHARAMFVLRLNENTRLPGSSNPTRSVCAELFCPLFRTLLEYSSDLATVLSSSSF
jgi:hypothetical protein